MSGVYLRIQYATGQVEQRSLGLGSHTVGRETGDIVLHDANVSTAHARLDIDLGRVLITDLGSSNGTYDAAGQRLSGPVPLAVNQPVRLGNCTLTLLGPVGGGGPGRALFTPPGPPAGYAPGGGYSPAPGYAQQPGYPPPGYPPPGYPPPGYPPPGGYAAPGGYGAPGAFPPPYVPPGTPTVEMDYAQWAPRALGHVIDNGLVMIVMAILGGVAFAISVAVSGAAHATSAPDVLSATMCCIIGATFPVASIGLGVWNRCYLVSKRGYSLGQGVMNLKVVDHNGQLLTFGNAFLRLLAQIGLQMIAFGWIADALWPLFDPRRQTLHDKAVNCYVINRP